MTKATILAVLLLFMIAFQGYRSWTYTNPDESPDHYARKKLQDYRFIFIAGKTWARGLSPHIPENFKRVYIEELDGQQPTEGWMSYPPTLALVALPIGFLPWKESILVYDMMNYISFILCLLFCDWIFAKVLSISRTNERLLIGLICGAALASNTGVLSTGQTSLFSLAGILGAFYFWLQANPVKASLCLLFASIKPQLCALPMLFLFVENYRIFIWTTLFILAFSLISFLLTWEKGILHGYLQSMLLREGTPFNQMNNLSVPHRISYLIGGKVWRLVPEFIGLGLFALYYYLLKQRPQTSELLLYLLGLPLALTLLFFPIHSYDYCIALFPVVFLTFLRKELLILSIPTLLVLIRPSFIYYFSPWSFTFPDFIIVLTFICFGLLYLGLIFFKILNKTKILNQQFPLKNKNWLSEG